MMRFAMLVCVCLGVTACTGAACLKPQPYQKAEAFPPLQAPAGLNVPEPDPNFAVPEAADGPVGTYPAQTDSDDEARRCLENPPRLGAG